MAQSMHGPHDTTLDAIASQVRSHPPLPLEEVGELLQAAHGAPRGPAEARLIRHHLGIALDAALARRDTLVEVGDLFQEGSVAVVTAVEEYAARGGDPAGLQRYVARVVGLHLDVAAARDTAQQEADEAVVRDSRLYETAEVGLRRQLGRPATTLELAAALGWPEQRVALIGAMLADARTLHDEEILDYLDDLETDDDDGEGH
jgi:DNA-directed RNA polymerase specialized sigma subunit